VRQRTQIEIAAYDYKMAFNSIRANHNKTMQSSKIELNRKCLHLFANESQTVQWNYIGRESQKGSSDNVIDLLFSKQV
jgi:hypothetical protein